MQIFVWGGLKAATGLGKNFQHRHVCALPTHHGTIGKFLQLVHCLVPQAASVRRKCLIGVGGVLDCICISVVTRETIIALMNPWIHMRRSHNIWNCYPVIILLSTYVLLLRMNVHRWLSILRFCSDVFLSMEQVSLADEVTRGRSMELVVRRQGSSGVIKSCRHWRSECSGTLPLKSSVWVPGVEGFIKAQVKCSSIQKRSGRLFMLISFILF